ncbi:hypothetical protein SO802_004951 [Lithocarpus litseifolius]|uniref:RNase H type-1 domain-containing protein n=1 Tax=Lithocarpus litseifolius TaxID=425828 RepID=A0AAW2DGS9_9ROSI
MSYLYKGGGDHYSCVMGYAAVTDVWVGSIMKLQKGGSDFQDVLQLVEYLVDRLSTDEMELFWVQSWLIWNQRNCVLYGGQLKNPKILNRRAEEFLQEFKQSQVHLTMSPMEQPSGEVWQPPPSMVYKLNFDAAIFSGMEKSGIRAIIRNERGEVMAGMSAIGPMVETSEEAELLACRRSLEFAVDVGFTRVMIKGDNSNVMQAISSAVVNYSFLGNVVDDIRHLMSGLQWVKTSKIRRGGNKVVHVLAQHARNLESDLYWLEDSPPPALEALYQDALFL